MLIHLTVIFLSAAVESLRIGEFPIEARGRSELYQDDDRFPSDFRLEYVPGSHGKAWRLNEAITFPAEENRKSRGDGSWLNRLLVVPDRKFAFCYVEKVACTQFNLLMNHLNNITDGDVWFRSTYNKFNLSLGEITKENGWFRGVFLRDPKVRFLSGYKSKCLPHHDGDPWNCIINPIIDDRRHTSYWAHFHKAATFLADQYPGGNPHFDPMTSFCGGLNMGLEEYDYVGKLSGGHGEVRQRVAEMLKLGGIEFDETVEKIFPATAPHSGHATNTGDSFKSFYDAETEALVEKAYAADYDLLKHLENMHRI